MSGKNEEACGAGIIILGHGSRLESANSVIPSLIESMRNKLNHGDIVPAYLHLARPGLSESIEDLISRGHRDIIIVPFFLLSGNHVIRDIPEAVEEEISRNPHVNFKITRSLGEDARIADIIKSRIKEASESEGA